MSDVDPRAVAGSVWRDEAGREQRFDGGTHWTALDGHSLGWKPREHTKNWTYVRGPNPPPASAPPFVPLGGEEGDEQVTATVPAAESSGATSVGELLRNVVAEIEAVIECARDFPRELEPMVTVHLAKLLTHPGLATYRSPARATPRLTLQAIPSDPPISPTGAPREPTDEHAAEMKWGGHCQATCKVTGKWGAGIMGGKATEIMERLALESLDTHCRTARHTYQGMRGRYWCPPPREPCPTCGGVGIVAHDERPIAAKACPTCGPTPPSSTGGGARERAHALLGHLGSKHTDSLGCSHAEDLVTAELARLDAAREVALADAEKWRDVWKKNDDAKAELAQRLDWALAEQKAWFESAQKHEAERDAALDRLEAAKRERDEFAGSVRTLQATIMATRVALGGAFEPKGVVEMATELRARLSATAEPGDDEALVDQACAAHSGPEIWPRLDNDEKEWRRERMRAALAAAAIARVAPLVEVGLGELLGRALELLDASAYDGKLASEVHGFLARPDVDAIKLAYYARRPAQGASHDE